MTELELFLNSNISQGSVATHIRCGEIFIISFLLSLMVKEFWKSVNIWRSYGQEYSVSFSMTHGVCQCCVILLWLIGVYSVAKWFANSVSFVFIISITVLVVCTVLLVCLLHVCHYCGETRVLEQYGSPATALQSCYIHAWMKLHITVTISLASPTREQREIINITLIAWCPCSNSDMLRHLINCCLIIIIIIILFYFLFIFSPLVV